MMDYFSRVSLHGTKVALLPISLDHVDALQAAGADRDIWRWMPGEHFSPGTMTAFVEGALALRASRRAVPFTTLDKASGRIVGSTRYHYIEPEHRRLEIGMTWLAREAQRSHVNSEAKLLQLWFAFEVLGCRRVEWKTDAENVKSRAAIARLGAREEGLFRKHMIYPDGRRRDSVYFALLDDDWPEARRRLEARLGYAVTPSFVVEGEGSKRPTASAMRTASVHEQASEDHDLEGEHEPHHPFDDE